MTQHTDRLRTGVELYDEQDPERLFLSHARKYRTLYGCQRIAATIALLKQAHTNDGAILDIGCGAGLWAAYLSTMAPTAEVHLLDTRHSLLCAAARTMQKYGSGPPARSWHGLVEEVGLPSGYFSLVLCKDVIEHVPDDSSFVRSIAKCLKPGGLLVLTTQNRFSLNNLLQGFWIRCVKKRAWCGWDPTHLRFYDMLGLRRLLHKNGLYVLTSCGAYLLPYRLCFRGPLGGLLRLPIAEDDGFPITDRPLDRLGLLHKCLAFFEWSGLNRRSPFSAIGWSIGVLARKVG